MKFSPGIWSTVVSDQLLFLFIKCFSKVVSFSFSHKNGVEAATNDFYQFIFRSISWLFFLSFSFLCLILWMWRYIQSQKNVCLQLFSHMHVVATCVVSGPQPYRLLHTDFRDWSLFLFFSFVIFKQFLTGMKHFESLYVTFSGQLVGWMLDVLKALVLQYSWET